ncbi:unnamed protein product [Clavelina lepadiformis]|uniref:Mitotic checkpoint serine/threonine-protein kinase BUB1 n=1 Tax=Clavelina lepadiformis TaxID=159417 RepID=A0ABP0FQ18_CLALP
MSLADVNMTKNCCDEVSWEVKKENVQPLRTGRNMSYLKAALQPSEEDVQHLMEERRHFEEDILAGENGNDPIDAWDRYLKWTQQHFPIGGQSKNLENLLRKYINKFLQYTQYKNDPRYVNAWLTMSQLKDNADDTYAYMRSEGIGTKCASFYVMWAEEHEKYDKYKKAQAIYELGENNEAQPAEILIKMKNAFELRIARAAMTKVDKDQDTQEMSGPLTRPGDVYEKPQERLALGMLTGRGNKKIVGSERTTNSVIGPGLHFSEEPSKKQVSCRKLTIFHDSDSSVLGEAGKWAAMPDAKKQDKENVVHDPQPWKGAKAKQKARVNAFSEAVQPKVSTFTIYKEEATEKDLSNQVPPQSARKVACNIEHLLTEKKLSEESAWHRTIRESYGDKDTNVVRMYPVDKVYSVMGEFQPEEILAAQWRKKVREQKDEDARRLEADKKFRALEEQREKERQQHEEEKETMEAEMRETREKLEKKEQQLNELIRLLQLKLVTNQEVERIESKKQIEDMTMQLGNVCDQLRNLKSLEVSDINQQYSGLMSDDIKIVPLPTTNGNTSIQKFTSVNNSLNLSKLAQPSPTLCTKEALGEIQDMFSRPIDSQQASIFAKEDSVDVDTWKIFCDDTTKTRGKFDVFCDENEDFDNSENIPTLHYKQESKRQELAGILLPASGFQLQKDVDSACQDRKCEDIALEGVFPLLDNENEPAFLRDVTVAKGQGDNFDTQAYLASTPFQREFLPDSQLLPSVSYIKAHMPSNLQGFDDSVQGNFLTNEKISAESTSYGNVKFVQQTMVEKEISGQAALEQTNEINIDNKQSKKLSPILEASDETDKSVLAKTQHSDLIAPHTIPKSFIHPPTVNRKPLGLISAVKYKEECEEMEQESKLVKPSKPVFSIFADDESNFANTTTNVQPSCRLSPEISLHQLNREHTDVLMKDLCSEMLSTSITEHFLHEKTDLKVEPLPEFSIFKSDVDCVGAEDNIGNHTSAECSQDVEMAELVDKSAGDGMEDDAHIPSTPTDLNLIHNPWQDDLLRNIMDCDISSCCPEDVCVKHEKMAVIRKKSNCRLGSETYLIENVIGEGAFAKVYLAQTSQQKQYALKVQAPAYQWEVYALQETKRRLKSAGLGRFTEMLMHIHYTYIYNDASVFVCDYLEQGTLLDLIRTCVQEGKDLDYVGIALTILELVNALHSVGIIHGDVKPDNFMVVATETNHTAIFPKLKMIDFGRAIDLSALSPSTAFTRQCGTSGFECAQMKLNQPWSYHVDFYGIAGTLYVLIMNNYMKTYQDKNGQWKTTMKLPRWCTENWNTIFATLLNFETPTNEWCPTYDDSPLPRLIKLLLTEV